MPAARAGLPSANAFLRIGGRQIGRYSCYGFGFTDLALVTRARARLQVSDS